MTDERDYPGDVHDADELNEGGDEALMRMVRELRAMPAVDSAAKARILVAVAAERSQEGREPARRRSSLRTATLLALASALAAAVVLSPWATRSFRHASMNVADHAAASAPGGRSGTSTQATVARAASANAEAVMIPVQLVVRVPSANHVAVVGDFTGWDEGRVAMTRDAASGLWSATISVRPGRHVYAFVADDSIWMRDPRAPLATDSDFGRPGSVLLVGRP